MTTANGVIETQIPARMDRLPWSNFHWLVVIGLGVTWILDGLEVTLAGAIGGVLKETFKINDAEVGATATAYLIGAVVGAIVFGYATDRLGRKKLFTWTLVVYLVATAASALSWNYWSYMLFRAITGMGIGGGYAAINSAIDELIPAKVRGRVDLVINSTYWLGAALGAGATVDTAERSPGPRHHGLALRLRHRRRAGNHRDLCAQVHPGKPALADDPWLRAGGQPDCR